VGIRFARARLQINSQKLAIHSYLYTRTVNASKIHAIRLQAKDYEGGPRWIFRVELTSGTGFGIESFDCGSARNPPIPELAAIVEEIRVLLGVSAMMPESARPLSPKVLALNRHDQLGSRAARGRRGR
jgi:hypothetical protein